MSRRRNDAPKHAAPEATQPPLWRRPDRLLRAALGRAVDHVLPPHQRPIAVLGALALTIGALVGTWATGTLQAGLSATGQHLVTGTAHTGLAFERLMIDGRQRTEPEQILDALGARRGDPLLSFSVEAARRRLEAISWVRRAEVHLKLPDTVHVYLEERTPLALWQHEGEIALIDDAGTVLTRADVAQYRDLMLVVGPDAPEAAPTLVHQIEAVPAIADRVAAAVRQGGRRWDLRLENEVVIRLPAEDVANALARLAQAQSERDLLERAIVAVDLRMRDRLVVEMVPGAKDLMDTPAEDT